MNLQHYGFNCPYIVLVGDCPYMGLSFCPYMKNCPYCPYLPLLPLYAPPPAGGYENTGHVPDTRNRHQNPNTRAGFGRGFSLI